MCGLSPDLLSYHTKWHLDPSSRLATIDMGQKLGAVPLLGEWELGPHLTPCGLRRGLPPSFILIHATVWPQSHQRHRQTGEGEQ